MIKKISLVLAIICLIPACASAFVANEARLEYNKGVDCYKIGQYEKAAEYFRSAINISPDYIDAYYDLGHVCFELGDYESAISNFENVIEYQENNELLYYALAQAYEGNNEIDKAISNYLKSIAVNDKFVLAYKKVGILFLARNDYEDAIEYFEDYISFDIPDEEKDSVQKLIERIRAKMS